MEYYCAFRQNEAPELLSSIEKRFSFFFAKRDNKCTLLDMLNTSTVICRNLLMI